MIGLPGGVTSELLTVTLALRSLINLRVILKVDKLFLDLDRPRDGPGWVGFCAARNPARRDWVGSAAQPRPAQKPGGLGHGPRRAAKAAIKAKTRALNA